MKLKLIILGLTILLSYSGYAFAHEGMDHDEHMESMMKHQDEPATTSPQAVEVGNKICPVSGDKIPAPGQKGEMGEAVKYQYNGKIYNLCCKMCIKDFKKNPEKYSKIAEDEVAKEKMIHEKNKEEQRDHAGHDQK